MCPKMVIERGEAMKFLVRRCSGLVFLGVIVLSVILPAFPSRPGPSAADSQPTVDSFLEKYVQALGGKEAIDKIRSRKLTGDLPHDFPAQSPPKTVLPAEVIAAGPNKWRLILQTAVGLPQMGFHGEHSWAQGA